MKFSEKLFKNYECKKMTVVKDKDGDYGVFSTLDEDGDLRCSDWYPSIDQSLKNIGVDSGFGQELLDQIAEEESWQIIKTIDFSELGGKGYKDGDWVRIIATSGLFKVGEVFLILSRSADGKTVTLKDKEGEYAGFIETRKIEPYFEDEHECEEEVPTMNLSERLDMIDRKIGIVFEELGITELKCGILSKKKS